MLFSPKERRIQGYEQLILETLQRRNDNYFTEPSQEINTQLLFQDHQVNNFYYNDRTFTHRNINQFYINGQIQIPETYQLNNGISPNNHAALGTVLH
jgi:hypothetical protein